MNSVICRRDFISRGLLLTGAALTWSAGAALVSDKRDTSPSPAPHARALSFAQSYSVETQLAGLTASAFLAGSSQPSTRITARVADLGAMQRALSQASAHGISQIHASGCLTAFTLDGHHYEIENIYEPAALIS